MDETTLAEMIGNVLVAAEAVHEEYKSEETENTVWHLGQAQKWAERSGEVVSR